MPITPWNASWPAVNQRRSYPLADTAGAQDTTGTLQLPTSFLVGLHLPVPCSVDVDPSRFYLRQVAIYPDGVSVLIAYDLAGEPVPVAAASVPRASHVENKWYRLGGRDEGGFGAVVGTVALGRLDELDRLPPGLFVFDPAGGRLDPDCIRPQLAGVDAVYLDSAGERTGPLRGIVELTAGLNTRLSAASGTVVWDAIEGAGLSEPCPCDTESPTRQPILTINGVGTATGDMLLVGSDCLEVSVASGAVRLDDVCSQPCCGPAELEALKLEFDHLVTQVATLQALAARVDAAAQQTESVVLGSRLSEDGCARCGAEPPPG